MKLRKQVSAAILFVLALIAQPALSQKSKKTSPSTSPVSRLLRLDNISKPGHNSAPGQDAVARGLAKAKTYKFSSADYPGASTNFVFDKNSTAILGDTEFASILGTPLGFTLTASRYTLLSVPGSSSNSPTGINTSGQIVGIYIDASNVQHGLLDTAGVIATIDVPPPTGTLGSTFVYDLNDTGEMVGSYQDSSSVTHGFSTPNGVNFTTLDYPGGTFTEATGVNSAGTIVGYWVDSTSVRHGFVTDGSVFTSIDFPLAQSTTAIGINDSGEIAGWFEDADGNSHGFIFSAGAYSQVDVAGALATELTRVKDGGNITGVYIDSVGEPHGLVGR